jgi:hypothetical protein
MFGASNADSGSASTGRGGLQPTHLLLGAAALVVLYIAGCGGHTSGAAIGGSSAGGRHHGHSHGRGHHGHGHGHGHHGHGHHSRVSWSSPAPAERA